MSAGLCVRQDLLEIRMRVAFDRNGEWRADLHRGRAERQQRRALLHELLIPPAMISGMRSRSMPELAQQFEHAGEHGLEVEARIVDVLGTCRAEVSARIARMLDHDGVRQPLLAQPLLEHDAGAAHVRQISAPERRRENPA